MDADEAWGLAFMVYILLGLIPMSNSAVNPPRSLPDENYRRQWRETYRKRVYPLFAWVAGLIVLIIAWSIFA